MPQTLSRAVEYLYALADKNGGELQAGKTSSFTMPAEVPVKQFWSLVIYDPETMALIYNPLERAGLSSFDLPHMQQTSDGSVRCWDRALPTRAVAQVHDAADSTGDKVNGHAPTAEALISADDALQRLIAGNERFLRGASHLPRIQKEILADLAEGQQPYATILGCSDSRVPPELIFDVGFGELFIVRVAGNVLSPEVGGSLQYARAHLHTPLFVVLGHEGCGAVEAAIETKLHDVQQHSRIRILVNNIIPGLFDLDPRLPPEARLSQAIEANVRWTMHQFLESSEAKARLAEGQMKLVGAVYEIESGRVRFLP